MLSYIWCTFSKVLKQVKFILIVTHVTGHSTLGHNIRNELLNTKF
jgi:hypothetical protein